MPFDILFLWRRKKAPRALGVLLVVFMKSEAGKYRQPSTSRRVRVGWGKIVQFGDATQVATRLIMTTQLVVGSPMGAWIFLVSSSSSSCRRSFVIVVEARMLSVLDTIHERRWERRVDKSKAGIVEIKLVTVKSLLSPRDWCRRITSFLAGEGIWTPGRGPLGWWRLSRSYPKLPGTPTSAARVHHPGCRPHTMAATARRSCVGAWQLGKLLSLF